MEIIAHRGFWKKKAEQNSLIAFKRAFNQGFGVETDLRDLNGIVVISHDMPSGKCLTFEEFLKEYRLITENQKKKPFLALNIKSDGLQELIKKLIQKYNIEHYFVFDMSIPDTLGYLDQGINTFTRKSEIEPQIALYNRVEGIWLDQFKKNWVTGTIIKKLQYDRKQVCIVSPELHNRQYETYWKMIKETINTESKKIMLCTDYPNKAKEFFDD